jgi:hypothetical protein
MKTARSLLLILTTLPVTALIRSWLNGKEEAGLIPSGPCTGPAF